MASPLHDNLRRDAHTESIADERASARVGDEIKAEAMKKFDDFWLDKKLKNGKSN